MTDDKGVLSPAVPPFHNLQGVVVAVAVDLDGPLFGLLLTGAPGVGKTSLAMALVHACTFRRTTLVADDMVELRVQEKHINARAPKSILGMAEIRGYGPVGMNALESINIRAELCLCQERQSRLGEWGYKTISELSITLPMFSYGMEGYAFSDHAFRIQNILRCFLTGQMLQVQS